MSGYGEDDGFEAWLEANGYELPETSPSPAILRQRGSDYLDGKYGDRFPGVPAGGYEQERSWPRTGATVYGAAVPDDVIPLGVVRASYAAAYQEGVSPGSLSVSASGSGQIKREKTDVLETEYFEGAGASVDGALPTFSEVEGLLRPFLLSDAPAVGLGLFAVGC